MTIKMPKNDHFIWIMCSLLLISMMQSTPSLLWPSKIYIPYLCPALVQCCHIGKGLIKLFLKKSTLWHNQMETPTKMKFYRITPQNLTAQKLVKQNGLYFYILLFFTNSNCLNVTHKMKILFRFQTNEAKFGHQDLSVFWNLSGSSLFSTLFISCQFCEQKQMTSYVLSFIHHCREMCATRKLF